MKTTLPKTSASAGARQSRQADLRAMLRDRQREMQNVLQTRVRLRPSVGPPEGLDETEHAEAGIQEHIEIALIQLKGDTLKRVREALLRLDAGEYGDCADCGGEIAEPRLRALPFAVRCRACEELHEHHAARERRLASPQGFSLVFSRNPGP
jgi:DnaK suppressor protein